MNLYMVAELLHKTVVEILAMPVAELQGWIAFTHIRNEK